MSETKRDDRQADEPDELVRSACCDMPTYIDDEGATRCLCCGDQCGWVQ